VRFGRAARARSFIATPRTSPSIDLNYIEGQDGVKQEHGKEGRGRRRKEEDQEKR